MAQCNDVTWSGTCNTNDELDFQASNGSTTNEGVINLDLPEGTKIYNQAGELIATIDGEPDKTKVRIPPSA
tara:strand:- start:965 stop:1177 length:213 start_codon:yes stop_codon:yes gene_type:complete